jgi:rubrerythrin
MARSGGWSDWWRSFLGVASNGHQKALEILRARYVEQKRHAARYQAHAERMQYPQFRERLLAIAADDAGYADSLAERIKILGERLPDLPPLEDDPGKTSWQYLLDDLNEKERCSASLIEEAQITREKFPAAADVLEQIYRTSHQHREDLREMLMRSDPQSH